MRYILITLSLFIFLSALSTCTPILNNQEEPQNEDVDQTNDYSPYTYGVDAYEYRLSEDPEVAMVAIAALTGYMIDSIFQMYSRLIPRWQQRSRYIEGKVGAIVLTLCLLYTMAVRVAQAIFRQYKRVTSNQLYDKICDKIFEKTCEQVDVS